MIALLLSNLITLTLAIYNYEVSRQVKYEGCMKKTDYSKDFNKITIPNHGGKETHVDVFSCVKECWLLRNKVAGLQKGAECYCAKSEMNVVHVPEEECSRRCKGNCYQTCGGDRVMSVFQTGYVPENPFEIDKTVLLSAKIGCYSLLNARSVLCDAHFAPLTTARMTVPMCIFYCDSVHKTMFATLSATDSCCCSNSVAGARNGMLEWCNIPCTGSISIGCVGMMFNTPRVATFQLSGETFTNVKQKLIREAEDASLSGLMARKKAREHGEGDGKYDGVSGQDKREPAHEGLENSVAVVDVPIHHGRLKENGIVTKTKTEEDGDKTNVIIIVAVVIGFAVFTAAFGFYIFSKRSVIEEKNLNANAMVRRKRRKSRRQIKQSSRPYSKDRNAV